MTTQMTVLEVSRRDRTAFGYGRNRSSFREWNAKARLYIHHDNESVVENFGNRAARPTKLYREVLPKILDRLGLPAETKLTWSRTAGCSCGCSPGFIIEGQRAFDAWATVGGPKRETSPEAEQVAVERMGQLLSDPTIAAVLVKPTANDSPFPVEILN